MNKSKKIIIIFILILLFILFCILTVMTITLKRESNDLSQNTIANIVTTDKIPKTIKDIIEKYDSEYISQDKNKVYAILAKDLYDENGNSNEEFITNLAKDLDEFFPDTSFYIIDQEKNVTIFVKRSTEDGSFNLVINDNENFYKETNGKDYSAVDNSKIVEETTMHISNFYLELLEINSMYFRHLEKYLTNGRELDDGYTVYADQKIKVKLAPNKTVFNLIFMEDYEDNILYNVSLENRLKEIAELYDDYVFGSLDKGYLGYRAGSFYYFFYENEASIYPYAYRENTTFEQLLSTYLETKNLDNFVSGLKNSFKGYSDFEYDADIQKLFISYPTRGIKIEIEDNDPKGITLYSNYHFSDTTKRLVKDGKIKYNKKDYVDEYEQMRKAAK